MFPWCPSSLPAYPLRPTDYPHGSSLTCSVWWHQNAAGLRRLSLSAWQRSAQIISAPSPVPLHTPPAAKGWDFTLLSCRLPSRSHSCCTVHEPCATYYMYSCGFFYFSSSQNRQVTVTNKRLWTTSKHWYRQEGHCELLGDFWKPKVPKDAPVVHEFEHLVGLGTT